MPTTVKASYNGKPEDWPVPQMPDLTGIEPWHGVEGSFWKRDISNSEIDLWRTEKLAAFDVKLSCGAGNKPYMGTSYGMPFNIVDESLPKTKIWNLNDTVKWSWFRPTYPVDYAPFPPLVRREGDPGESSDQHWYGYDPEHGWLYELILVSFSGLNRLKTFGQTEWTHGYNGGGAFVKWNTLIPWNAAGQPKRGIVAAGIPQFPLVVRYEEMLAGHIDHCFFAALANYARAMVGVARGFDGDLDPATYPLRAGDLLRLKSSVVYSITDPHQRVFANAARKHGILIGDRNAHNTGHWEGPGGWTLTQDVRWQGVSMPTWNLSDFEVVAQ